MNSTCFSNVAEHSLPSQSAAADFIGWDGGAPREQENAGGSSTPAKPHSMNALLNTLLRCWDAVHKALQSQRTGKRLLRVSENVSLGDKRFVAVIQVDQERFLIGGAANSIAMLARLSESTFPPSPVMQEHNGAVGETQ